MFHLFKKKTQPKTSQEEVTFSLSKMEFDGKVFIVRFKNNLLKIAESGRYPFQMGIAVPLKTNQNGFPTKEENEQLLNMELILETDFSHDDIALFVGAIVGGGMKEFIFYTGKPSQAKSVFENLKKNIKHHELQSTIRNDPDWKVYKMYHPSK